jgi:hypothetical protein
LRRGVSSAKLTYVSFSKGVNMVCALSVVARGPLCGLQANLGLAIMTHWDNAPGH